jgi:hypothetical protein
MPIIIKQMNLFIPSEKLRKKPTLRSADAKLNIGAAAFAPSYRAIRPRIRKYAPIPITTPTIATTGQIGRSGELDSTGTGVGVGTAVGAAGVSVGDWVGGGGGKTVSVGASVSVGNGRVA